MKAMIYARQSSGDDEQSLSIEVQIENCIEYAKKNGFDIAGIFRDANFSGRCYPVGAEKVAESDKVFSLWFNSSSKPENKKFRSGLGQLFASINKGDVIIIDDATRLMRPLQSSFLESYINQILISKSIIVHTCKGGLIDVTSFNDNLISTLQNLIESQSIIIKIQKANAGRKKLKNDGFAPNGKTMLGYKNIGYQKYIIVNEEAEIVKKIFELGISGLPFASISKLMKNDFDKINRKPYTHGMISKLLNRPEYCGLCYDSENNLIESKIFALMPLISKKQFFAMDEIFKIRSGRENRDKKQTWALSGLLFCSKCNQRMIITKPMSKGKRISQYYYCQPISETTKHFRIRYNDLNKLSIIDFAPVRVGETIKNDFFSKYGAFAGVTVATDINSGVGIYNALYPLIFKQLADDQAKKACNDEILEKERLIKSEIEKIANLEKKLGEMLLDGAIDDQQFKNSMGDNRKRKSNLIEELHKIEVLKISNDDDTLGDLVSRSIKSNLSPNEIKLLFQKVFEKIYVFENHIQLFFNDENSFDLPYTASFYNGKHQKSFPNWQSKIVIDNGLIKCQITYLTGSESILLDTPNFRVITK